MKLLRRTHLTLTLVVAALGCERAKAPPPTDSVAVRPAGAPDTASSVASSTWDAGAGPVLLVSAGAPDRAYVVTPDSANSSAVLSEVPHQAMVTLFSRSGSVQTANLPSVPDSGVCVVASLSAAPPPHPWSVGFIGGVVSPIPLDSTASIAPADSQMLVTWMNRLASALPNDSAGRFTGLPFVVRDLWRFNLQSGPQVVVGNLVRQLNMEATPLEELTFLIAERSPNDTTFSTAYSERSFGPEETIESRDVLAAATLGSNRDPALIVSRDFGDATAYGLIERGKDQHWRRRWMSARRHCGG